MFVIYDLEKNTIEKQLFNLNVAEFSTALTTILPILLLSNDMHQNPGADTSRYQACNLFVVNLNVNSVRNKTDLIYTELGDHDIICITESKLNNSVNSEDICIDNYLNHAPFRRYREYDRGGGIILYIKNNLLVKRRSDLELNEIESVCVECVSDNRKVLWTLSENFNINVCAHLSCFRDFSQVIYNISNLEIYKTKEYLPRAKLCP